MDPWVYLVDTQFTWLGVIWFGISNLSSFLREHWLNYSLFLDERLLLISQLLVLVKSRADDTITFVDACVVPLHVFDGAWKGTEEIIWTMAA